MSDIAKFIAGFQRFHAKYFQDDRSLFSSLRNEQKPRALVISCCDSRVDPVMLTGADPGDLFIVRNVANLVPPYIHETQAPGIRAAIEFAIKTLEVEHIIVLGHSNCGGIQALMNGEGITENKYEFIGAWIGIAQHARENVLRVHPQTSPALQARACEQAAILTSLENLRSFPWIRKRIENKTLALHGWYFDIDAGALLSYREEAKTFVSVTEC